MARGPLKQKIKKGKKGQLRFKGISGIAVKPTEQEVKIAEGIAAGRTKKEALIAAGVSEKNARSNSRELTNTPGVRKALDEAFRMAGVGIHRIALVIDEGLSASKMIATKTSVFEYPDHAVRHQFVRTASELLDLFPDKKLQISNPAQDMSEEQLDRRINELMAAGNK